MTNLKRYSFPLKQCIHIRKNVLKKINDIFNVIDFDQLNLIIIIQLYTSNSCTCIYSIDTRKNIFSPYKLGLMFEFCILWSLMLSLYFKCNNEFRNFLWLYFLVSSFLKFYSLYCKYIIICFIYFSLSFKWV